MDYRSLQFPDPSERRREIPEVFRDPVRATVFIAAIVTAIGTLLPWLHASQPGYAPYDVSGFEEAGDGGLILELVLVAAVIAWSERAWQSRLGLVVAGPLILAVLNLFILRLAWVNIETFLRFLERAGGTAELQPGIWITLAGTIILGVAGAIAVWRARRRLTFGIGLTGLAVAGAAGGVGGGILGFIAGAQIAQLLAGEEIAGVYTTMIVILAFTLAFVGAWVGAIVATGAARSIRR